jgi:hypothetical protein
MGKNESLVLLAVVIREAALCCINSNVWFTTEPLFKVEGSVDESDEEEKGESKSVRSKRDLKEKKQRAGGIAVGEGDQHRLFLTQHQPNRELLAARGIKMMNPHCIQVGGDASQTQMGWNLLVS